MAKKIAIVLCFLLLFPIMCLAADSGIEVNVKDFGAVGDGKSDDTASIRKAIEAAGFAGTVRFPKGSYKISGVLDLKDVHLLGNVSGGFPSDADVMPRIVVTQTAEPAVKCGAHSSVHGLSFNYPAPNWDNPVKTPPAILLAGNGIEVSDVKIWGAYDAIAADGVTNIGRVNLENIFLPEVVNTGVYLTKAYDIPTMRNVEVFCTNKYFMAHGVGFKLGRLDEFHASNCFVIGAQRGFEFVEDKTKGGGNTYGGLVNCSTDFCGYGYWVSSGARLRITNGSYLNHGTAFVVDNKNAVVILDGALVQSNGDDIVKINDCRSVIISACRFQRAFENPNPYEVHVLGGGNVIVSGCEFDAFGPGILLEGSPKKVSITGNIFEESKFPQVTDKLSPGAKKYVSGNL